MFIARIFNEFMIFSCIGWLYECTYCTVKEHRWQNRGFLFGPVCPIYGFGATFCVIIFGHIINDYGYAYNSIEKWKIFLICMVGSAIMELLTSYVLERVFHAAWWDYSDMPLNFQGRICLPASLGFGVAGVLVVRKIIPMTFRAEGYISPIANEIMALLFMAVFAADIVLTVSNLTDLLNKVEGAEESMNAKMQYAYATIEHGITENQLTERAREYVSRLNFRQINTLRNMKFRGPNPSKLGVRMKNMVLNVRELDKIKEIKNLRKRKKDNTH